jgi:hypothetical protein
MSYLEVVTSQTVTLQTQRESLNLDTTERQRTAHPCAGRRLDVGADVELMNVRRRAAR